MIENHRYNRGGGGPRDQNMRYADMASLSERDNLSIDHVAKKYHCVQKHSDINHCDLALWQRSCPSGGGGAHQQ